MTDYDDKEESQTESAPVELYKFEGSYTTYRMTSALNEMTLESVAYTPIAGLARSSLSIGTHEDDDNVLEIKMPITEQIVKDYGFQTSPPELQVTVYRLQRDALTWVEYWVGSISGISIKNEIATFKSPSRLNAILNSNIPTMFVQPPCNNVLFDSLCKVARATNSLDTTVSTVTDNLVITIPSLGSFEDGWFQGGEISISSRNERRTIVEQTGTSLTVNYPFAKISAGTAIQVTAGCDHSFEGSNGCPKFSNQVNFGGIPYAPGESDNVFYKGV